MTNFDFLLSTLDFATFANVAISAEKILHIDMNLKIRNKVVKAKRTLNKIEILKKP